MNADDLMQHWPLLVGTVKHMLPTASHAVWEDVAADTLEKAIRNLHRFEDRGEGAGAWLATMARRQVIDHVRRQQAWGHRRQSVRLTDVYQRGVVDAGWQHHAEQLDVRTAIAALPDDLAEYVSARQEGYSQEEAGRRVGWGKTMSYHRNLAVRRALAEVAS